MKIIFFIGFIILVILITRAQSPQGISYQAVVRDASGNVISNQQVNFKFTILQDANNGEIVYQEIQSAITNSLGIVNLTIGSGNSIAGNFSDIDWGHHIHYLKVEVDLDGSNNYTEAGITQLVSVPYALYANTCGNVVTYTGGSGIDITNGVITNTAPDQEVTLNAGPGISISGTYPNFTISSTVSNYTAGEGISITNGVITNTAPDQPISLNAGYGINVSGTYPSYTITNSAPDQVINLNSGNGINITGEYPNFTINSTIPEYTAGSGIEINNGIITNTAPDQIITINAGPGINVSGTYPVFSIQHSSHSGDITGNSSVTVTGIQGNPISAQQPQINSILLFNGTMWIPVDAISTICNFFNYYYADHDNDGYGDKYNAIFSCSQPEGYVSNNLDNDDRDSTIYPGAPEICDNKDNNQDGIIDPENSINCINYYYDYDDDGWGVISEFKCLCNSTGFYRATKSGDCNDNDQYIHPGATEICNGKDDNCNGVTDDENAQGCNTYYYDNDNDGFGLTNNHKCLCTPSGKYTALQGGDCNDNDQTIYPGATEICNGKDDNCNGITDEENAQGCQTFYYDFDNDGFGVTGNSKCLCSPSGGYKSSIAGDCNDNDPTVYPGAVEKCNSKDDNCNGQIDENCVP